MTLGDIIVGAIVFLVVVFAVYQIFFKSGKKGTSCDGCSGCGRSSDNCTPSDGKSNEREQ